jgi:UDP-glucuronate 4-epimerase
MAPMLFADAISHGRPINVFNNGDMIRDFTFIDDIAFGSIQCLDKSPEGCKCPNGVPFRVFNIGCSNPVRLMDFISEIEEAFGLSAEKIMKPMQPGDVYMTNADSTRLEKEIGYKPRVNLHEGIGSFIEWYKSDKNPLK